MDFDFDSSGCCCSEWSLAKYLTTIIDVVIDVGFGNSSQAGFSEGVGECLNFRCFARKRVSAGYYLWY